MIIVQKKARFRNMAGIWNRVTVGVYSWWLAMIGSSVVADGHVPVSHDKLDHDLFSLSVLECYDLCV